MFHLIKNFDKELQKAIEIAQNSAIQSTEKRIQQVLIAGMGGSGIGGSFVHNLVADELKVPYIVNKGYFLPAFVNEYTLVIICSYSGNTEESIHAFHLARQANAQIACITSGGQLLDLAKEHHLEHIVIDGGRPPRASMGYSIVQLLWLLIKKNIISTKVFDELAASIKMIQQEQDDIISASSTLADKIINTLPAIYCEDAIESIAIRWKQQLNENSKMLCMHNCYPELNHNELVGWREINHQRSLIFLKTGNEFERNKVRMQLNEPTFEAITPNIHHVIAKGSNKTEKFIYLLHYGDWLSYHLAILGGYDAMEIKVLIDLKTKLADI